MELETSHVQPQCPSQRGEAAGCPHLAGVIASELNIYFFTAGSPAPARLPFPRWLVLAQPLGKGRGLGPSQPVAGGVELELNCSRTAVTLRLLSPASPVGQIGNLPNATTERGRCCRNSEHGTCSLEPLAERAPSEQSGRCSHDHRPLRRYELSKRAERGSTEPSGRCSHDHCPLSGKRASSEPRPLSGKRASGEPCPLRRYELSKHRPLSPKETFFPESFDLDFESGAHCRNSALFLAERAPSEQSGRCSHDHRPLRRYELSKQAERASSEPCPVRRYESSNKR